MRLCWSVGWSVGPHITSSIGPLVSPHITSKTDYVAIASRRGEGRGNWLILKTGYVKIASRLVTVARSCLTSLLANPRRKAIVT
jgi:hypothetical protein